MIKQTLAAEIQNKALPLNIQGKSPGAGLAFYIAQLWKTIVLIGGLAFLVYLVWGGLELMTASGDKDKLEKAHHKITNSLIGLTVLVGSYAIVKLVEAVFGISLLQPAFPSNLP